MPNEKYSWLKKYIKSFIALVIFTILMPYISPTIAYNKEYKTIKVGYCNDYGIVDGDDGSTKTGYIYDYLNEISKYTDFKYEFIQCTWEEALEKLKIGEIDIVGPMQYSDERLEFYDFTERDIGKEYGGLYTRDGNELIGYDDYEAFDGITVATIPNDYHNVDFNKYCVEKGFSVNYVYYESTDEIMAAVANNEADAFISGSITTTSNSKVLSRFSIEPMYLAVKKGNSELLNEINMAIKKIQTIDIYYEANLYKKYFDVKRSKSAVFTNEEERYIKYKNKIRVVYDPDWYPIEYYDDSSNSFKGSNVDILKYIGEYSGLDLVYIKTDNYKESFEMVENGSADILCGIMYAYGINYTMNITEPYYKTPIVFIGINNTVIDKNTTVVMPENHVSLTNILYKEFPDLNIKISKTMSDCLKEVHDGKGDVVTVENFYAADQLLMTPKYDNLRMVMVTEKNFGVCSAVSPNTDPLLLSILNKSINQIPTGKLEEIRHNNSVEKYYSVSIKSLLMKYSIWIISIVCVVFALGLYLVTYYSEKSKGMLTALAYKDRVTGRDNLNKFKSDVKSYFETHDRTKYEMILFDIDKFKYINDIFGYKLGDFTLKAVSDSIQEDIVEGEFFARGNADSFVILCHSDSDENIETRIEKLFVKIKNNSITYTSNYELILNAGVYQLMEEDSSISSMIDRADIAKRTIKGKRSKPVAFYTQDLRNKLLEEKEIENSMESALLNNEFIVYLQPKFSMITGKIAGAEALIRWKDKNGVIIPPIKFIPVFEKNGFVINVDFFVFEEVCKKFKLWIEKGVKPLPISVNLSRVHLQNDKFIEKYNSIIKKYDVPAELIEIELTESAVFDNMDVLMDMMDRLKKIGFGISMDDFGTGYSSLGLLKNVPVDILKLDREFLNETSATSRGEIVIRKIVEMAKELGIGVVAEGVETEEQVKYLTLVGCDIVQGFYYAKPMEINDFEELLYGESFK